MKSSFALRILYAVLTSLWSRLVNKSYLAKALSVFDEIKYRYPDVRTIART